MTEEELAELRAYKPAEVAQMLNVPITRLETWARKDRVPHLRAGVSRGVEFTVNDIRWNGRMRPELMGGRHGGGPDASQGPEADSARASVQPTPEVIAGWAQLRAHRPATRTGTHSR
ncbi:hypothetical protein [Blastococcus sp. SYSU DS0973]